MNGYETKRVDLFAQLEKELNLFEREYCGVRYWHVLRFSACEAAFGVRTKREKRVKKTGRGKYVKVLGSLFKEFGSLLGIICPKKCDVLMYAISALHERFFSSIELPNGVSGELYRLGTWKSPTGMSSRCHGVPSCFLGVVSRFNNHKQNQDSDEKSFLLDLERIFKERFGQSLSAEEMEKAIQKYIRDHDGYCRYYERMFRKTGCRLVLITCYYTGHVYAIETAHKMGIPVVELQHGVINNHICYRYEDIENTGWYIPDYLLTYGEVHKEWIKLPLGEKAIAVGYAHQQKRLGEIAKIETDEKLIVVYPKLSVAFENEIDELAHKAAMRGYKVVLKVHPGQANGFDTYFPLLANNKDVEVVKDQSKDVYYWLKKGKFHVMASSTVGLEAMVVDNAEVFVSLHAEHEQVQPLLDWDAARGYETVDELLKMLESAPPLDKTLAKNRLWKENAVENIKAFLREELK